MPIAASPFATKAAALDRANLLPNGRPAVITVRNASGDSAIVSYDAETLTEYQAKGYNAIPVAEQNAIDVAATRAAAQKPILDAAAAKQAADDASDTKTMLAELLAQWRKNKAPAAAK